MNNRSLRFSFINKIYLGVNFALAAPILGFCFYSIFALWADLSLPIKIIWLILMPCILIGMLMTFANGLFIKTNGNVIFIPDFRIKRFYQKSIKRIAINFNEWENGKYSAVIKVVYEDGKLFVKDYSKQFRDLGNWGKKYMMGGYTIRKSKVDEFCNQLSVLDFCNITIIDKNSTIVYQKIG